MNPQQYVKKPVQIEAMGPVTMANRIEIARWCGGTLPPCAPSGTVYAPGIIGIRTLEGTMYASSGDWIIKGTEGEFYPCKPKAFEATFELADAEVVA